MRSVGDEESFSDEYAHLSADELLQLRAESESLLPRAREALHAEILKRGLENASSNSSDDAPVRKFVGSGDSAELHCLDDWEEYRSLTARRQWWWKNFRWLALVPFGVAVVAEDTLLHHQSTPRLQVCLMAMTLLWVGFVIVRGILLVIKVRAVRCPRCNRRFGSEEQCMPCGFPRHSPVA